MVAHKFYIIWSTGSDGKVSAYNVAVEHNWATSLHFLIDIYQYLSESNVLHTHTHTHTHTPWPWKRSIKLT